VADYLGRERIEEIRSLLGKIRVVEAEDARRRGETNHDLFPRDEFLSPVKGSEPGE
jgi:hypothetical protein